MDAVTDHANLAAVLLDAYDPQARGGTGRQFNWDLVAAARSAGVMAGMDPIILAGGLDPSRSAHAAGSVSASVPPHISVAASARMGRILFPPANTL